MIVYFIQIKRIKLKIITKFNKRTGSIINTKKSSYSFINDNSAELKIENEIIPIINYNKPFKYLGFLISMNLDWKFQQNNIINKIKSIINIINNKKYIFPNLKILLINQVLLLIITYKMNYILFNSNFINEIKKILFNCFCSANNIWKSISRNFPFLFRNLNNSKILNIQKYLSTKQRILYNENSLITII